VSTLFRGENGRTGAQDRFSDSRAAASGLVFPCLKFGKQEHCVGDDAEPVCHTSTFFVLLAARSPSANRSLIAFTDGMQASLNLLARGELVGNPEASQS
jgi:hypothetical protein